MTSHPTASALPSDDRLRGRVRPGEVTQQLARSRLGRPLARAARRVLRRSGPPPSGSDYTPVVHRGQPIPPLALRNHMCGEAFLSNDFYLQSAVVEATRLPAQLGFRPGSRVIDVGCGLGRLATGMIEELGEDVDYLGIEPNRPFYEWCRDNIEASHPAYRFVHVDVVSELYNPQGTVDGDALRLPVETDSVDIVYVWGVFTNIIPEHVETYVAEFRRVVRDGGRIFLTAYVEDDCPQVSFNPEGYVPFDYVVPLNVVRFNRAWVFSLFEKDDLEVVDFRYHGAMFPKQSEITLTTSGGRKGS